LLRIEEELGAAARFAGFNAFTSVSVERFGKRPARSAAKK